ncbi:hypothetical protein AL035_09430 [Salipiger aestuarii]|nr:hypothetical protein AL035_09430 [Salipiger aestuarii]
MPQRRCQMPAADHARFHALFPFATAAATLPETHRERKPDMTDPCAPGMLAADRAMADPSTAGLGRGAARAGCGAMPTAWPGFPMPPRPPVGRALRRSATSGARSALTTASGGWM